MSTAISIGERVVTDPRASQAVRFEALNALGIAWMRLGECYAFEIEKDDSGLDWSGTGLSLEGDLESLAKDGWGKAQSYFEQALELLPNSVRVLQNMATMRLLMVKHKFATDTPAVLQEAKRLVRRSLEVNDQDQFPFYQLAQIAILEKNAAEAFEYINQGRSKPGAVKVKSWAEVQQKAAALSTPPYEAASQA
jgi:tetratricopeptide (TPR) repeat protein